MEARVEDASSGARVDLAFSLASERVAIEIEMGEAHTAENVRKDLASGYDRVLCLIDQGVSLAALRTKLDPLPQSVLLGELQAFEIVLGPVLSTLSPDEARTKTKNQDAGGE